MTVIKRENMPMFNDALCLEGLKTGQKGLNPCVDFFSISAAKLGAGRACLKMPVLPECLHAAKIMQGGLIVALADDTIAYATMSQLSPDEVLTTMELKHNFPASVDSSQLIAEVSVF